MNDKQVRTHTPEDVKKIISKWMIDHGYATGHGDTIEDLFKELEWQVAEREREWDGPTDEEYENFCSLIQREEAKLKEKNT